MEIIFGLKHEGYSQLCKQCNMVLNSWHTLVSTPQIHKYLTVSMLLEVHTCL